MTASIVVDGASARAAGADDAKKIFNQQCTGCHTFGRGVKVGPDLKGVAQRRPRPWLLRFIRSSQTMVRAGDPTARALFAEFKQQRMPDWPDLSDAQLGALVDWLASDGPEQREPDERSAELATDEDVARARRLFHGELRLTYGGLACAACHAVEESGRRNGGTFGPELTQSYLRFRDSAMTLFLKRPCSRRSPESESAWYLTPDEAYALKAYLQRLATQEK